MTAISQEVPVNLISNVLKDFTLLKLLPHLAGVNDLN